MMESDTWGFSACHPVEKTNKTKEKTLRRINSLD
jgi:hypothetical protein